MIAPTGGADPFAASVHLVTALVAELQAPEAAGLIACELEQFVVGRGREVLRQMVQDHLDLRAAREQETAREQRTPGAGEPVRLAPPRGGNLYPAGAALSLSAPRHSHALARLAALETARSSFGDRARLDHQPVRAGDRHGKSGSPW